MHDRQRERGGERERSYRRGRGEKESSDKEVKTPKKRTKAGTEDVIKNVITYSTYTVFHIRYSTKSTLYLEILVCYFGLGSLLIKRYLNMSNKKP